MATTEERAREIAGRCVDPMFAEDSKIALFAATGEIEAGLGQAVGEALDYARENRELQNLAAEIEPLEELWAWLQAPNPH